MVKNGLGGHYITSLMGKDHMAISANASSEIVLPGVALFYSVHGCLIWAFCLPLKINM